MKSSDFKTSSTVIPGIYEFEDTLFTVTVEGGNVSAVDKEGKSGFPVEILRNGVRVSDLPAPTTA